MKLISLLVILCYIVKSQPTDLTGLYALIVFNDNGETPSLSPETHKIVIYDLITGNVIREREVDEFQGLTIDRSTNIIYSVNFRNGEVEKWDICLETETICGDSNLCPAGLDFVPGSAGIGGTLIASEKGTQQIFSVNTTSGETTLIGLHDAATIVDLILTKDGNGILTTRRTPTGLLGNILPPTIGTTTGGTIANAPGHTRGADGLDWLFRNDLTDTKLFMCYSRTGEPKDCYIYDQSTGAYEGPILTFSNDLDAKGVKIITDIGTCPTPTPPGGDDPRECLCDFNLLNPDLQYCRSECCGIGMIAQTNIDENFFEYGINIDDFTCYIKQNGNLILTQTLTQEQFYQCEQDLAFVTQDSNCTISQSKDYLTIYSAVKSFVNGILGDSDISLFLVICYGLFIFMLLATFIFFIIKCIKGISNIIKCKNNDGYSALFETNTDAGNNTATANEV